MFGVILGTGCGGGLVFDGALIDGPRGIGGEWGHNPLPWPAADEHPGPQCWCGRRGCMETWVSGPGLEADHARATGETAVGRGDRGRARRAGDAAAQATLDRHASRLARGLAHVVNIFDPDVIVLGGGLSKLAAPLRRAAGAGGPARVRRARPRRRRAAALGRRRRRARCGVAVGRDPEDCGSAPPPRRSAGGYLRSHLPARENTISLMLAAHGELAVVDEQLAADAVLEEQEASS